MTARRIGLIGGTFDPIHRGHLDAARAACAHLHLDHIVFVPAHVPPHRSRPVASGYHRFAMTALAIQDDARFAVDDTELLVDAPSYTAHTLRRFGSLGYRPTEIVFITGIDAFAEIATWHAYPDVLDAAHFAVVQRPGFSFALLAEKVPAVLPRMVDAARLDGSAHVLDREHTGIFLIDATTAPVSSTLIRRAIAAGSTLDDALPPAVRDYIVRQQLYLPPQAGHLHEEH